MAEVVELHKLKLAELKQECTARGLEAKGNKADLIARLQAYLDEHEVNEEEVLGEYGEEAFAKEETDSQKQEFTPPEEVTEKKLVKINPPATVGERLQKRAARFNIAPSADSKKAARAARFGLQEPDAVSSKGELTI
ncbi:SAP domain-containing ribonucleoprotein-like isoform X2 [Sinocyclocheilus grahami]|uniref:SAP domain-containing ribonucleoprotein-like isoform X2 n=1 Tax=Sinocyclocheilus grahami TaxID=75366 RepID=UPI0007AD180B|nr:PREDICTED: SAP domain-containing ribonucleoprotein-like isoform X2 [Sinocyclocheilus grahami]